MPRGKKTGAVGDDGGALVTTLPGAASVDAGLLDHAVANINRIYQGKGLEMAREAGEYVLHTFFAGDPENFRNRGKKHVTFRQLAQRKDLQVSYTTIWNAVAVLDQLRLLPENIASALPLSHHKLLLPIKDPDSKVKLAQKAVDKSLSKRTFEDEVRKARQKQKGNSTAGRPALPAAVKSLHKLARYVSFVANDRVETEGLASYKRDEAQELLGCVELAMGQLQTLRGAIAEMLQE